MKGEIFTPFESIIPCAGKGTRFREITHDEVPKPLQQVGEKRLIEYTLEPLKPELINHLVFVVGHRGQAIREWVMEADLQHKSVSFSEQTEQGFLGAVNSAVPLLAEDNFIISTADEIKIGFDLEDAVHFHNRSGRIATIIATYRNNLFRERILTVRESDNLILGTELHIEKYREKPEEIGLVNMGFLIMNRTALSYIDLNHSTEFSGLMDPLVDGGQIGAYIDSNIAYFNVGTPEEYFEALAFLENFSDQNYE